MNNPSAPGPGERISAEQADKALEIEFGGLKRNLVGWQARALAWLGAGYVVVHLLILNVHPIDPWIFRTYHVSIGSVIGFAIYAAIPADRGRIAWYDWTMMAASVAILAYIAGPAIPTTMSQNVGRTPARNSRSSRLTAM